MLCLRSHSSKGQHEAWQTKLCFPHPYCLQCNVPPSSSSWLAPVLQSSTWGLALAPRSTWHCPFKLSSLAEAPSQPRCTRPSPLTSLSLLKCQEQEEMLNIEGLEHCLAMDKQSASSGTASTVIQLWCNHRTGLESRLFSGRVFQHLQLALPSYH